MKGDFAVEQTKKDLTENEIMQTLNEMIPMNSINKSICIFGQGFVGLPLALSFAIRGCIVTGIDIDDLLVANINKGITHHTEKFYDVSIQNILNMQLISKKYKATTDAANAVKRNKNIIVTVGIPIKNGTYVMDYLENACRVIGQNLKNGDLVIIRSTVIPGTTEEFILPILENKSGMRAGRDFYLAYASERIAEGVAFEEFANMPTLVGAINDASLERAIEILRIVCKAEIIPASCIKAVETSKVFENVQRDVNIAMSQEFARFTEALGIDIFEVIKLANTHKRVNLLTPGPGVGGYCVPNAYYYLKPKAKILNVKLDILELARKKNASLPIFIVNKVEEMLNSVGKQLNGSTVTVLGLAMKDFSNDDRISPPINICKILLKKGTQVLAFDPTISTEYVFKVSTQIEAIKSSDVIVILAKQKDINYYDLEHMAKLMNENPLILDTKNIVDENKAKTHGFILWKI